MGKSVSYSGKTMRVGGGYFGRPSSGASMGDLWNYAKQSSKVKPYQVEQRKLRPYQESILEKTAYSTVSKDSHQPRIISLSNYTRNLDSAYEKVSEASKLRTRYRIAA